MALALIRGGAQIETATPAEIRELLDLRERERARGIKWVEFAVPLPAAPANTLLAGPEEGYTWSVRVISSTLGSAGTLAAYKASSTGQTTRLVGFNSTSQTAQVMQYPSDTLILQHGTGVYLVASTTLTNYYVGAWQAIAEQQWKLMD
jgi:hypothetical protein